MKPVRIIFFGVFVCGFVSTAHADIASVQYVQSIISSISATNITRGTLDVALLPVGTTSGTVAAGDDSRFGTMVTHIADTSNPHSVTKAQVGLGNVSNVDTTNAANITSGTMDVARLPVGTTSTTVAAGNDARFDTISTTQPSGTPPTGTVFVWFD